MNKETFALRREKLRRLMYEEGLDAASATKVRAASSS